MPGPLPIPQERDKWALQAEIATNLFKVGHIQSELGRKEDSLAVYGQARDIFAGLAKRSPGNEAYRADLATVWRDLGRRWRIATAASSSSVIDTRQSGVMPSP